MIPPFTDRPQSTSRDNFYSPWIRTLDWLDEVDSTNSLVKQTWLATPEIELPWLVVADRQTSGKGRNGNQWWSPDGCLVFSLAITVEPEERGRIHQLPLLVGMSIAKTLRSFCGTNRDVRVKWPNDIMVGSRKISGVLIESFSSQQDQVWVIGVGLNVRVPLQAASAEVKSKATSLHQEVDFDNVGELTSPTVLAQLLDDFQNEFAAWKVTPDFLSNQWEGYCFLKDKQIQIRTADAMIRGVCLGIDESGGLMLVDESGRTRTFISGSIESWT